jgi:hypothetical protein
MRGTAANDGKFLEVIVCEYCRQRAARLRAGTAVHAGEIASLGGLPNDDKRHVIEIDSGTGGVVVHDLSLLAH